MPIDLKEDKRFAVVAQSLRLPVEQVLVQHALLWPDLISTRVLPQP